MNVTKRRRCSLSNISPPPSSSPADTLTELESVTLNEGTAQSPLSMPVTEALSPEGCAAPITDFDDIYTYGDTLSLSNPSTEPLSSSTQEAPATEHRRCSVPHGRVSPHCHICCLPEGPLVRIFQFLDLRSKYAALGVCSEWKRVLENPCLWTKLVVPDTCNVDHVIEQLLSHPRFHALEEVDLPHRIGPRVISLLIRNCPEVETVKLRLSGRHQLMTLVPLFKRLTTCCISYPQVPPQFHYHAMHDLDLPNHTWTKLERGCFPGGLSDRGLHAMCQVAPLVSLDLSRCDSVTERGILTLLQGARHLRSLVLPTHIRDPERFGQVLDSLSGPLSLSALYSDGLSDLALDKLVSKCPNLELLYINPHILYRRRGTAQEVTTGTPWLGCSLRALGFRACSATIESILNQQSVCSRLEFLCLFMSGGSLSDDAAAALARNCSNLRALTLNQCGKISRRALCSLSSCRFRTLSLIHCSIDYIAIEPLDGAWACLRELAIIRCDCTFGSLVSLVLGCRTLSKLMIDDVKVVDHLAAALGRDLPRLEIRRGDETMEGCRTCREMRQMQDSGVCCMDKLDRDEAYVV